MAPIGYADGLLKPANQVRAQKALVKHVPGSNLPKQPAQSKKVMQSVEQQLEAQKVKQQQQAYLPPSGSVGPIREVQQMKGLSGITRDIDFDKTFKTREQIGKIATQADELRRGRTISEVMQDAENLGHTIRHNPQLAQDLRRDQIEKRRHAMVELVRTNRHPAQNVEDHVKIPRTPYRLERRRLSPGWHRSIATPRGAASDSSRRARGPILRRRSTPADP